MKYYILREKHFCKIVFPAPFSKNFYIKHFQCFMGVLLELYVVIHREIGFLGKGYGENLLFCEEVSIFKKLLYKAFSMLYGCVVRVI